MTKYSTYLRFLFIGFCLPVPTWGEKPVLELKKPAYGTTYDYIINSFKGAVEYIHGSPSFRSGGIVVGYYLYKYHHQPLYVTKERKRIAAAHKDFHALEQPDTREGEANFMMEGGIYLSTHRKWTLHDNFYVADQLVDVPIGCRWTIPIRLIKYNVFSSTSVGCMIQYLRSSMYDMYEIPKRNLTQEANQQPFPSINLKTKLNDMPFFYYSLWVGWGLVLPVGVYTNFIFYFPLDSFYLGSKLTYKLQIGDKLTSGYVQSQRSAQRKILAWSVGIDFCRLLSYFNNTRR